MTRIKVKVRFNSSQQRIEKFGPNMFLMYLEFDKSDDSMEIISEILARSMGIPKENVNFAYVDSGSTWIFDLE